MLIFDTLLGLAMICHPLDDEEAEKLLEEQELLYASKSLVNSGQQFPDLSYVKLEKFYREKFGFYYFTD